MMKEKEDLPSVVSGNTSTPEDATPCFSENEPAHNFSKNLNNGSPTTKTQPDYAHNSTPTPRPHASRATTDTPAPRPHASRATTDTPAPRPHASYATTDTPAHTRAREVCGAPPRKNSKRLLSNQITRQKSPGRMRFVSLRRSVKTMVFAD